MPHSLMLKHALKLANHTSVYQVTSQHAISRLYTAPRDTRLPVLRFWLDSPSQTCLLRICDEHRLTCQWYCDASRSVLPLSGQPDARSFP